MPAPSGPAVCGRSKGGGLLVSGGREAPGQAVAGTGAAPRPSTHLHHLQRHPVVVALLPRVGRVGGADAQRAAAGGGAPGPAGAGGGAPAGAPRPAPRGPRHRERAARGRGVGALARQQGRRSAQGEQAAHGSVCRRCQRLQLCFARQIWVITARGAGHEGLFGAQTLLCCEGCMGAWCELQALCHPNWEQAELPQPAIGGAAPIGALAGTCFARSLACLQPPKGLPR